MDRNHRDKPALDLRIASHAELDGAGDTVYWDSAKDVGVVERAIARHLPFKHGFAFALGATLNEARIVIDTDGLGRLEKTKVVGGEARFMARVLRAINLLTSTTATPGAFRNPPVAPNTRDRAYGLAITDLYNGIPTTYYRIYQVNRALSDIKNLTPAAGTSNGVVGLDVSTTTNYGTEILDALNHALARIGPSFAAIGRNDVPGIITLLTTKPAADPRTVDINNRPSQTRSALITAYAFVVNLESFATRAVLPAHRQEVEKFVLDAAITAYSTSSPHLEVDPAVAAPGRAYRGEQWLVDMLNQAVGVPVGTVPTAGAIAGATAASLTNVIVNLAINAITAADTAVAGVAGVGEVVASMAVLATTSANATPPVRIAPFDLAMATLVAAITAGIRSLFVAPAAAPNIDSVAAEINSVLSQRRDAEWERLRVEVENLEAVPVDFTTLTDLNRFTQRIDTLLGLADSSMHAVYADVERAMVGRTLTQPVQNEAFYRIVRGYAGPHAPDYFIAAQAEIQPAADLAAFVAAIEPTNARIAAVYARVGQTAPTPPFTEQAVDEQIGSVLRDAAHIIAPLGVVLATDDASNYASFAIDGTTGHLHRSAIPALPDLLLGAPIYLYLDARTGHASATSRPLVCTQFDRPVHPRYGPAGLCLGIPVTANDEWIQLRPVAAPQHGTLLLVD